MINDDRKYGIAVGYSRIASGGILKCNTLKVFKWKDTHLENKKCLFRLYYATKTAVTTSYSEDTAEALNNRYNKLSVQNSTLTLRPISLDYLSNQKQILNCVPNMMH